MSNHKSIEYLTNHFRSFLKFNQEIVIVCIGTDRLIPDSLGPMVGTILSQKLDKIKVIGTLEAPLHALNMRRRIKAEMKKNAVTIAIDANKGDRIGEIQIVNRPISPGKGFLKDLPLIGHISILGTTWEKGFEQNIYDHKIRLGEVYKMARIISTSIYLATNELSYDVNKQLCNL